jgi:hypothetical protein
VANASGEAWYRGELDFTGGEMVLVLKLIALAVCLQDFYKAADVGGRRPAAWQAAPTPALLGSAGAA